MLSFNEALQILDSVCKSIKCLPETIAATQASNRVLAADQYAKLDIPPFNRSAMDGYAILPNDDSSEYHILETVAAGQVATKKLMPGTTIKIMTGAPVPPGTAKVVPIEQVTENQGKITIPQMPRATNISPQGEDIKCGSMILAAGTMLGPIEIANLIAVGITEVAVYQMPKIALISTGDEIVTDPKNLQPGKIMDSNGPMLQALCKKHGLPIQLITKVKDDYQSTVETLRCASEQAAIVILSGGVSVGDFDYVTKAIAALGFTLHFNKLAIKPARPTTFASKDNKLIFGLPGNPAAVFLAFYLFVMRALKNMLHVKLTDDYLYLPLAQDFQRKSADRLEFVPAALQSDGTILPLKFHGSAHLVALLACKGFFVINQGVEKIAAQERVKFWALN